MREALLVAGIVIGAILTVTFFICCVAANFWQGLIAPLAVFVWLIIFQLAKEEKS